nr:hypothetical protein [Hyphomonas sp. Mor2]
MSKKADALWVGPTAMFVGFSMFFFGAIWRGFMVDRPNLPWEQLTNVAIMTVGVLLLANGAARIMGKDEEE